MRKSVMKRLSVQNKLKPCPFCGGKLLEMDRFDRGWFVTCYECPCRGVEGSGRGFTREEAIKEWNTRYEG